MGGALYPWWLVLWAFDARLILYILVFSVWVLLSGMLISRSFCRYACSDVPAVL